MRRLLVLVVVLLFAVPASAADEPKPNTLTSKEIAEGWLLLFDGETTFGWHAPNGSNWTVAKGLLAPQAGKPGLLVTTTAFADYELMLEFQSRDRNVRFLACCDEQGKPAAPETVLSLPPYDGWWRFRVQVEGGHVVNSSLRGVGGGKDVAPPSRIEAGKTDKRSGFLGLSGNSAVFRTIKLRPLGLKPLFNGKDLSGWKKFDGEARRTKSVFSVTKEGWLHLQNGPGDLQTEGQYADFVLQLECISNGDRLNSGVFFRCRPGEYQQGYEAQIHNGWNAAAPKEYTVEEYDPQTHELKDKKRVKSAAIDYGTGAIYRRVPARREVARDREWFTMTVVAQGRHLATWVNGYPEVAWTDNRPLKDNARNGCRLEKGPISLQGHDPTTDLSFRNLRIAELPPAK
jgi:hypothetical protein